MKILLCADIHGNHQALQALLKIALILNVLDEFDNLLKPDDKPVSLINPVKVKQRKRGKLK